MSTVTEVPTIDEQIEKMILKKETYVKVMGEKGYYDILNGLLMLTGKYKTLESTNEL